MGDFLIVNEYELFAGELLGVDEFPMTRPKLVFGRPDSRNPRSLSDADDERLRLEISLWVNELPSGEWPLLSETRRLPWLKLALERKRQSAFTAESQKSNASAVDTERTCKNWEQVSCRLEELRQQGEQFSSQRLLAQRIGCSVGTINKAITKSELLRSWSKHRKVATPVAEGLTSIVIDNVAQRRELRPEEEAAIREYLEQNDLDPKARVFFKSLKPEDQLYFLDDPDKHRKIFRRV